MSGSVQRGLRLVLLTCAICACESDDPEGTSSDSGSGGAADAATSDAGQGGSGGQGGADAATPDPDAAPDGAPPDPCNGQPVQRWCLDADGDGHGDADSSQDACQAPADHVLACDDCDDARADAKPGAAELCNTLDDDCDGTPDNGLGLGEACATGVGACEQSGQTVCLPNGEVGCDATPGQPTEETCNDVDDDCNGQVDDTGAAETCNAADDDCDGEVDEDLGLGDDCAVGVGACRAEGANVCPANPGPVECSAQPSGPSAEVCDLVDNDCDGQVDNTADGCECTDGTVVDCGSDVGECSRGTQACVGGRLGACTGATGPAIETCDGLDNDCDGAIDNRQGAACECTDGAERGCGSEVGACEVGTQRCVDGAWAACSDVGPTPEQCNGVDDDCNGVDDDRAGAACECQDGASRACGTDVGECAVGQETCVDGQWGACDGDTGPAPETCDGLDNDCTGQADDRAGDACECIDGEVVPCGSDVGACLPGEQTCVDGHLSECVGATGPVSERFDRVDNDCDGTVDNLVCEAAPTDFPAGPAFQGCVSQDGAFHAFDPANISTIARTQAFDQIAALLWRSNELNAAAFANARQLYAVAEGIDSRVQRRFDSHFEASVPAGTNCRTAGVPAQFPDYCVGPARILPIVVAAFDGGMAGQDLRVNAARIEAALLWFFYTSVYKEANTCATTIADCDSSHAYYSAATPRAQPAGLGRYFSEVGARAHERAFEGTLAAHCWRELDNGAAAANAQLKALAVAQLDLALDHGAAQVLVRRVRSFENAAGEARAADWAFIQIWGQALDRAVRVRDAAQADALARLLSGNGAGVTAAAVEDIVTPLIPCP